MTPPIVVDQCIYPEKKEKPISPKMSLNLTALDKGFGIVKQKSLRPKGQQKIGLQTEESQGSSTATLNLNLNHEQCSKTAGNVYAHSPKTAYQN